MPDKEEAKVRKKLAKAHAKAVKKGEVPPEPAPAPVQPYAASQGTGKTPAERSAEAAERQLALHRWKVIFGALSALIALVSLILLFLRG